MSDLDVALAKLESRLNEVLREVAEIKSDIKDIRANFISEATFDPVKKVVYGMVTLALTAIVGAIIALVLKQ